MFDFPERLRQAREAVGWTPYRLAKETGLSKQGALNLEQPGADPKLSTLFKLSAALGVPLEQLLGTAPAPKKRKGSGR
jgi:transcriptional regulator with XRE-family HTH domain